MYFTIVTLSTVGFGDIVPANDFERIYAVRPALASVRQVVTWDEVTWERRGHVGQEAAGEVAGGEV